MYLKEFKDLLIQNSIYILWNQWTKPGVWISSEKSFVSNSDPESAIAFSEYFNKYEGRLSKISASWSKNKDYINSARLKRIKKDLILPDLSFSENIKAADKKDEYNKIIAKPELENPENILLKLRMLFGPTTKAEIVYYLLFNKESNSNELAKKRYLNQKAVYTELEKLHKGGILLQRKTAREKIYSLKSDFKSLFVVKKEKISVFWILLFSVFILKIIEKYGEYDEYIFLSKIMDEKLKILMMLHNSGKCEIEDKSNTAKDFFTFITKHYQFLIKNSAV